MPNVVRPFPLSALLFASMIGTASPAHAVTNSGLDTNNSRNILNFSLNAAQAMMLSTSPRIDPSIVLGNVPNPTLSLEGTGQVTFQLFNSGSGVNQKYSEIIDQGGVITFRTVNDAYNAAASYLQVARGGNTNAVTDVEFPSGYVQIDNGLFVRGYAPYPDSYNTGYMATKFWGGAPNIFANGDNHNGGGVAISDDGGFYDYNDGWVTYNGATGLRIAGNNGLSSGGAQLAVEGSIQTLHTYIQGAPSVGTVTDADLVVDVPLNNGTGTNYAGIPTNWWGIHTLDLYANDSIGLGMNGNLAINMNAARAIFNMNVFANGYFHLSDARMKDSIQTAPGLDMVDRLRGVTFNWKKDGKPSMGVIAQEVEKVAPSAVATDEQGQKTVEYDQLIGPMIEAIKELKMKSDAQQTEINSLKAQLAHH